MRQIKSKSIRSSVAQELARRKIPWRNAYYRTTKKLYNATPRNERENFLYNLMK